MATFGLYRFADYPLVIERRSGKGSVTYFPWQPDLIGFRYGLRDLFRLIGNAVRLAHDWRDEVVVEGPGLIDVASMGNGKRQVLHLVNLSSHGSFNTGHRRMLEEIVPIHDLKVRMHVPDGATSVRLAVAGSEIAATRDGDMLSPSQWIDMQRRGVPTHSFLEGPCFDAAGNLYVVDIPNGRIFKVSPVGEFRLIVAYDGEPNGLKIHRDGRIFIADHKRGLLLLDPSAGIVTPLLERPRLEGFKGLNDLCFARNGDLYFTDQGQSGLHDPTGRLWRLTAAGRLDLLLDNIPSPNGVVLTPDESLLYVAATRANCIWRVPLQPDGSIGRVGLFIQLSGSLGGPDGLAVDEAGRLLVCHFGLGTVWVFSPLGEPVYRIRSCAGLGTTNAAFGGPDRKTLFITEAESGSILSVPLEVAGLRLS